MGDGVAVVGILLLVLLLRPPSPRRSGSSSWSSSSLRSCRSSPPFFAGDARPPPAELFRFLVRRVPGLRGPLALREGEDEVGDAPRPRGGVADSPPTGRAVVDPSAIPILEKHKN